MMTQQKDRRQVMLAPYPYFHSYRRSGTIPFPASNVSFAAWASPMLRSLMPGSTQVKPFGLV